jgi:polysaccharide pyruvyl transferase WcaK-like protein
MTRTPERRGETIAFYGHFNATNFGNEATLHSILQNLRRVSPGVRFICISPDPSPTVETDDLSFVSISPSFVWSRSPRNPLLRALYKACIATPSEAYRWIKGFAEIRRADALIVAGGGLVTDAFGLRGSGAGPYYLFKWALIAKLCRRKLLFVSVGAGPFYTVLGWALAKSALALADFRSYRDGSTRELLTRIGFRADNDRIYPDLAFSLCEPVTTPVAAAKQGRRPVVGVGLMTDSGRYGSASLSAGTYQAYRETLAKFVEWLLTQGYDVKLFVGDLLDDANIIQEFRQRLASKVAPEDMDRIVEGPVRSFPDLLEQIATTDFVVVTRFHNLVFALLCCKPVISLSFHDKCDALMSAADLTRYCLPLTELKLQVLIERFSDLVRNRETLKSEMAGLVQDFRKALDDQYAVIVNDIFPDRSITSNDRSCQ